jgi:hypothetical protein
LDYILKTDFDHTYIANCRGFCAGRYYHLLYPSHSASGGNPDKWLAIDLRRFPDIRVAYWEGLNAICGFSYDQGGENGTTYFGTSTGYVYRSDFNSIEKIDVEVETEDRIGGGAEAANTTKILKELKYNLLGTATLEIIIDNVTKEWPNGTTSQTITGTGDEVQVMRSLPNDFQGYKYRLKITATDQTDFKIYSPWQVDFDLK